MKKIFILLTTLVFFTCIVSFSVNAAGENAQKAVPINLKQSLNIEFNDSVYKFYLKYTPKKTGFYQIELKNFVSEETYITTYDSTGKEISFAYWNQFTNKCYDILELKSGKTYYFEITSYEPATVTALITNHSHKYEVNYIIEATDYNDGYIYYNCSACYESKRKKIPKVIVTFSQTSFTYNGKTQRPSVAVTDTSGKTFKEGSDYTVTYPKSSINVNNYEILVEMKNSKYDVSVDAWYYIDPKVLNKKDIKLSKYTVTYGETPTVTITGLKRDQDFEYDIEYYDVGKYTFTVYGIGNYDGSVEVSFNVIPKSVSNLKVSKRSSSAIKLSWKDDNFETTHYQIYDTTKKKIIATIEAYQTSFIVKKLKPGQKYTFKVRGCAKVSGEKYYSKWKTIETATNPKGTTIKSVKSTKSNILSLAWKEQSSATGYQIQYSTSSKFTTKTSKTLTIKKNTETTKSISKLKSNTKYFVRIRTYKTFRLNDKSVKLYSSWSEVKSAKVKK